MRITRKHVRHISFERLDDVGDPIDRSMTDFQITSFDSLNLLNPQISARIGGCERFWPCE